MAKSINVTGQMKVGTFKKQFEENFGIKVRVYNGKIFASDEATIASIRKEGNKKGTLSIVGQSKVGTVEANFKDLFGISIQVEGPDGNLADNDVTLGSLRR